MRWRPWRDATAAPRQSEQWDVLLRADHRVAAGPPPAHPPRPGAPRPRGRAARPPRRARRPGRRGGPAAARAALAVAAAVGRGVRHRPGEDLLELRPWQPGVEVRV